jgi:hypothetical protein
VIWCQIRLRECGLIWQAEAKRRAQPWWRRLMQRF